MTNDLVQNKIKPENNCIDAKMDESEAVKQARKMFGEPESAGLEYSWADPVAYWNQIYGDICDLTEQEAYEEAIESARCQLA